MGGSRKKRKKDDTPGKTLSEKDDDTSTDSEEDSTKKEDKYKPFLLPDYVRFYPEDGGNFEYIVFLESTDNSKPIGDRDMMTLGNNLKKYNKGVKQLVRMNKYKIGAIFERPGFANATLSNKKFLDMFKIKASASL